MVITMRFYTLSHGKFHDREYSDILFGINSIDIMGCCTLEHSVTTIKWKFPCSISLIGCINRLVICFSMLFFSSIRHSLLQLVQVFHFPDTCSIVSIAQKQLKGF